MVFSPVEALPMKHNICLEIELISISFRDVGNLKDDRGKKDISKAVIGLWFPLNATQKLNQNPHEA